MLVKTKSRDVLDEMLVQAPKVHCRETGEQAMFPRCPTHGFMTQKDLKFGFVLRQDCPHCATLGFFFRRALGLGHADENQPVELERLEESLRKAGEAPFDFTPIPRIMKIVHEPD